jgi:hypothetical protein
MHIVVDLDGTLRGFRNDEPIAAGILITGALSAYNQITFITDLSEARINQWLDENKVVDFDNVISSAVHLEGEVLKERQIKHARARGPIDLFITANPTLWAFAFEQGIPSIMFGVPTYLRAEFRPDAPKSVRAWDDIVEAVAKQNALMTKDKRLVRTETVKFGD